MTEPFAASLPRLRFRRPPLPSGWRIFYLWLLTLGFSAIAHAAVVLAQSTNAITIGASLIVLGFWMLIIPSWQTRYRFFKALEEAGVPLPPVPKTWWLAMLPVTVIYVLPWLA